MFFKKYFYHEYGRNVLGRVNNNKRGGHLFEKIKYRKRKLDSNEVEQSVEIKKLHLDSESGNYY